MLTNNKLSSQGLGDAINPIRQLIDNAQAQDNASGKLTEFVVCRKQCLHDAIKLPNDHHAELLADFVVR